LTGSFVGKTATDLQLKTSILVIRISIAVRQFKVFFI
jgi:hypothetical protein